MYACAAVGAGRSDEYSDSQSDPEASDELEATLEWIEAVGESREMLDVLRQCAMSSLMAANSSSLDAVSDSMAQTR